jgi:hypothetical protein
MGGGAMGGAMGGNGGMAAPSAAASQHLARPPPRMTQEFPDYDDANTDVIDVRASRQPPAPIRPSRRNDANGLGAANSNQPAFAPGDMRRQTNAPRSSAAQSAGNAAASKSSSSAALQDGQDFISFDTEDAHAKIRHHRNNRQEEPEEPIDTRRDRHSQSKARLREAEEERDRLDHVLRDRTPPPGASVQSPDRHNHRRNTSRRGEDGGDEEDQDTSAQPRQRKSVAVSGYKVDSTRKASKQRGGSGSNTIDFDDLRVQG